MSTDTSTYTEFAKSPTPWLPDQPFWEQNAGAVTEVMGLVATDYPHVEGVVTFDPAVMPADEQRKALWKLLMGRQHGNQEQSDGKVTVEAGRETDYRQVLGRIAVGPHPIMEEAPLDPSVIYDQVQLNGGTPLENDIRLVAGFQPNVKEVVALTGQRLRGMWENIPGETSVGDLFILLEQITGTSMYELARRSPWMHTELARSGTGWSAPFATEYHMYRLGVEARLYHLIDWENYRQTVTVQAPKGPNHEMRYMDGDKEVIVPPREEGAVTYLLKDGRKCHVVNGAATVRNGAPRATSTSIAQEAMQYVPVPRGATIGAVSGAPHLRAAMDTAIAYLNDASTLTGFKQKLAELVPGIQPWLRRRQMKQNISRVDIAAGPWEPRITHLVAALGELMATMKADYRLREVLRGGDPNKPELNDI